MEHRDKNSKQRNTIQIRKMLIHFYNHLRDSGQRATGSRKEGQLENILSRQHPTCRARSRFSPRFTCRNEIV